MFDNRNIFLYPFSVVYGMITGFRNFLYNTEVINSVEFDIPVICLGNITIGGTGKTPHTEYLAELLSAEFNVAVLSRGYKRKTGEFIIGGYDSGSGDIGDEPLQMLKKLPSVTVAVDKDRVHGIRALLRHKPETEVIILDDGFQHRRLSPGLTILLTDFERPMHKDHMIPFGSLRESRHNISRADIILVTKTPPELSPIQRRLAASDIDKMPYQDLYFTSLRYLPARPVFNSQEFSLGWKSFSQNGAVAVTGIANPNPFVRHIKRTFSEVIHLNFPDHHDFGESDIKNIISAWHELRTPVKYLITTEKDAIRIRELPDLPEDIKQAFFYIPVRIEFLNDDKAQFDNKIIEYVRKNKRNYRFSDKQRD